MKVWVQVDPETKKWSKAVGEIQSNNYCVYETKTETGMVSPVEWKPRNHNKPEQDKPIFGQ